MASEQPAQPWYSQTWVAVVALVLFFPVGLFLMWRFTRWELWVKSVVSVVISLFLILVVVSVAIGGDETDDEVVREEATPSPTVEAATPTPEPTEPMIDTAATATAEAEEAAAATATAEVTPEDSGEAEQDGGGGYSEDDPEYQLAVIDAGGFVPLDDPSIDTYAGLLDSLDAKCSEERSLIGDQAVRATQLLAEEGIAVSALEALQGIDGSIPEESPLLSCAEVGALWIALVVAQ